MIRTWRLVEQLNPEPDPARSVVLDEAMAREVGAGRVPPTLRIWTSTRCLVLGRYDHRHEGYTRALNWAESKGIPVVRRSTGGTAMIHGPETVSFSLAVPASSWNGSIPGIYRSFDLFCLGVLVGCRSLGVPVRLGRVERSFCGGTHDLVVDGRKVGGTAQASRQGYQLVHGTLLVHHDPALIEDVLRPFFQILHPDKPFDPETVCGLDTMGVRSLANEDVTEALARGYRCYGRFERAEFTRREKTLATERAKDVHRPEMAGKPSAGT